MKNIKDKLREQTFSVDKQKKSAFVVFFCAAAMAKKKNLAKNKFFGSFYGNSSAAVFLDSVL